MYFLPFQNKNKMKREKLLDYYQVKNSRLFVSFQLACVLTVCVFAILNFSSGKDISGKINIITILILYSNLIFYKISAKYTASVYIFLITCMGLLMSLHPTSHLELSSNLMFIPLLIIVSLYMLGQKNGMKITTVIVAMAIGGELAKHFKVFPGDVFTRSEVLQFNLLIIFFNGLLAWYAAHRLINEEEMITNDIQDQKASLFELNEAHAALLSIVGHDIANPLMVVKGGLKRAQKTLISDQGDIREYFDVMQVGIERIEELITNVRDMRAVESGKLTLQLKPVNLNFALETTIETFKEKAKNKNINIVVNCKACTTELILVQADRVSLINSVLSNLLSNAVKFSPKGSIITFDVSVDESRVYLDISDQGIGVPNDLLPFLFDARRPTTRKGTDGEKGTGLGLPLLKMFLDKYEAKIDVNSVCEEQSSHKHGTKFSMLFKRIDPKTYQGEIPISELEPLGRVS